jgi:hypothetical protein
MAIVHLSLLAGVLLIGIPIAVHMAMRPQPVRHLFPALQFVRERQQSSQRRLKLRRFLLLLLRCLAIIVAAIALARPAVTEQQWSIWGAIGATGVLAAISGFAAAASFVQGAGRTLRWILTIVAGILLTLMISLFTMAIRGETPTLLGDQEAPVSALLLVDTAPRMDYQYRNRSRLQQVQRIAGRLIEQFPKGSEVAVLDTEGSAGVFSPDRSATDTILKKLSVSGGSRPLFEQLDRAVQMADTAKHPRRELYVFTDMTAAAWNGNQDDAWNASSIDRLRKSLADSELVLYVIDVGARSPQNVSLALPRLEQDSIVRGGEILLNVPVHAVGNSVTRTVEIWMEPSGDAVPQMEDGHLAVSPMIKRGSVSVSPTPESGANARFAIGGLDEGIYHGEIRLLGSDSLEHDNIRFFTIRVREAWPILVVAPNNVSPTFVTQSLSPDVLQDEGGLRFDCTLIGIRDLANQQLTDYAAICLLDPNPFPEQQWQRLRDYVDGGGGLAVVLGHNAHPPRAFRVPLVSELLGGTLGRQWRNTDRSLFLAPQDFNHPVMVPFREIRTSTPWHRFPVFRHWSFDPLAETAEVLIRFANGKEAVVENRLGDGRVITLTTPLSDSARPIGRTPWNEFTFGEDGWPQFILINEIINYLVSNTSQTLNFPTGPPATLQEGRDLSSDRYQLFPPGQSPYQLIVQDSRVTIRDTRHAGNYRLRGRRGVDIIRGISVNYELYQTELERWGDEKLTEIFGEDRYELLRDSQDIERAQGHNRVGREFYPLLMIMLAVIVGLEQLLSNRFYSSRSGKE